MRTTTTLRTSGSPGSAPDDDFSDPPAALREALDQVDLDKLAGPIHALREECDARLRGFSADERQTLGLVKDSERAAQEADAARRREPSDPSLVSAHEQALDNLHRLKLRVENSGLPRVRAEEKRKLSEIAGPLSRIAALQAIRASGRAQRLAEEAIATHDASLADLAAHLPAGFQLPRLALGQRTDWSEVLIELPTGARMRLGRSSEAWAVLSETLADLRRKRGGLLAKLGL